MGPPSDVAIVGAGPYGLSIAAYLKAIPVGFRIFGSPMHSWHMHAPKDMRLKSEGFASSLYAPGTPFPIAEFCASARIPYADVGVPISVETFVDYGREFQRRYVPEVEDRRVARVERFDGMFRLWLEDGEYVAARRVVLATGLGDYTSIPPVLAGLPAMARSHSWDCAQLDRFGGREVVVVGAGASALNSAAALQSGGAAVTLLARRSAINYHEPPERQPRALWQRVRWPQTGIGTGWRSLFYTTFPGVFRRLPKKMRHYIVRNHLGPAPGWFVRDQVGDTIQKHTGVTIERAEMHEDRVRLHVNSVDGTQQVIETDHVVAATGFDIDLRRLSLLAPELLAEIALEDRKPRLSANFESSVPGLYFVGTAAAASFGPMLRFAYGAHFAAHRIARHVAPARTAAAPSGFPAASQLSSVET